MSIRSYSKLALAASVFWLAGVAWAGDIELNRQRNSNAIQTVYRAGVPHTDKNGRLLMKYDPKQSFFQIGLWGVPLPGKINGYNYDWNELKDAGYNTVWPFGAVDPLKSVKAGDKYGLQVVIMGEMKATATVEVKNDPSLLANVWVDEPMGSFGTPHIEKLYSDFIDYKEKIKKLAPTLPVFINDCPNIAGPAAEWWIKWDLAGDISCDDVYPLMDRTGRASSIGPEPNGIPQTVSLQAATSKEQKPVWLIIGAFDQPGQYGQAFPFRFATPEQLRACAYAGVIHGATGVAYFIWDSYISRDGGCVGMSPNPQVAYGPATQQGNKMRATPVELVKSRALWQMAAQVNKELTELTPAILSPTIGPNAGYTVHIEGKSPTQAPIRTLLKPAPDGGYILLTVNLDDAVLRTTYEFPRVIVGAQVLFENRQPESLAPGSKRLILSYEPFDAHIVKIKLAP